MALNNRYEPQRETDLQKSEYLGPRRCLKLGFQGKPRRPRATYRPKRATRSNEARKFPCPSRAAVSLPTLLLGPSHYDASLKPRLYTDTTTKQACCP